MNFLSNPNNPIVLFLSRCVDFVILNLLFILCSIPMITIGPSITALYYCMMRITRDRDDSLVKMFFRSFSQNFKQGCLLTVLFIAASAFLIIDINACATLAIPMVGLLRVILYFFSILLVAIMSYTFPLLAQFDNSIKRTLLNAVIISIGHFWKTIIIVFFNSIPFLMICYLPELFLLNFPVWLLFGFALISRINSGLFVNIFNQFIPESGH